MHKYLSELIGTFALVFAGTGAIIIDSNYGGVISHLGIAMTFGLIVMVMIFAVGEISGAHFNPAVTFGFWLAKRINAREGIAYLICEFAGALLASLLLRFIFPAHPTLGSTLPSISNSSAFLFEVVLTFFLMFVIIQVTSGSTSTGWFAGIAIGGTVCLDALFGGPVTGASMNPARSFGPALISGNLQSLWIYLIAPLVGAALAIALFQLIDTSAKRNV